MKPVFDENMPLGTPLSLITRMYAGVLSNALEKQTGMDRYYSLLLIIHHSGKQVNQQCIANILHMDKASITRIIEHLIDENLLKKHLNPENRREYIVVLTPKAQKLIPEIESAIKSLNRKIFRRVSISDRKIFYTVMNLLAENLETLPATRVKLEFKLLKENPDK